MNIEIFVAFAVCNAILIGTCFFCVMHSQAKTREDIREFRSRLLAVERLGRLRTEMNLTKTLLRCEDAEDLFSSLAKVSSIQFFKRMQGRNENEVREKLQDHRTELLKKIINGSPH